MRPETIMIETDNGPVMINKSEYNPDEHTLANGIAPPTPVPEPVPAGPVAVDANGNPVPAGSGGQFMPPAADPIPANPPAADAAPTGKLLVQKKGKKFFVVDAETKEPVAGRTGVDEAGYADENAAWVAVASATTTNAG